MQWPLIMVFAVWLCPYPDGVARVRRDGQRHRLYLPQPAWFLDVLRVNALTHHLSEGVNRKPASRIRGMAVVSTDGQQRNEGLLTPWSAEALLQMAYYAWPSDAYQVEVLDYVACVTPVAASLRRAAHAQGGLAPVHLDIHSALHYPYWSADGESAAVDVQPRGQGGRTAASAQWLGAYGIQDVDNLPCLQLPIVLVELIAAGKWSDVLCLSRWHSKFRLAGLPLPFGDWPGVEWAKAAGRSNASRDEQHVTVERLDSMGLKIREWVPQLRQALRADVRQGFLQDVEFVLESLDGWSQDLANLRGDYSRSIRGIRHRTEFLVECIWLSRALKGGAARLQFCN